MTKTYFTINQAAEFLGVHPGTLRRWDKTKKLEPEIVNKRGDRRYDLEELSHFKTMVNLGTDDKEEAKKKIAESLETLERLAEEEKYEFSMGDHFRTARDLAHFILEDEKESDKFQSLINLFSFQIKGDEFKSKMSGTDSNGKYWEFPSLRDFSKTDIKYIRSILPNYSHPRIRARIAHFLWKMEGDHKMAEEAINEYINVVDWLNAKVKSNPEEAPAFEIVSALESAHILAKKIKRGLDKVNKSLANITLNFENQSPSRWAVTHKLIDLALQNKLEFGRDFWENAIKICKKMADEQEQKGNLYFSRDFLSLGEKIERDYFKLDNEKWRQKIASSFEDEANAKEDGFVQSDLLTKAITEYKKLGNQEKVRNLQGELEKAKKNLKFQTFTQTIDLTDWVKKIREQFKLLAQKESKEQLLVRLTVDQSILPKFEEVKSQSEKMDKEFPLQSLFSHSVFDGSGNMPRKYEIEEEKKHYSLIRQYHFSLITYETLVKVLIEELIEAEKLDFESLAKYISNHLWYGKEYEVRDPDTNTVEFKSRKWLDLLGPGLKSYLNCLRLLKNKKTNEARDNLVLAIDSLTPKIEGLIREFYKTIGESTVKVKTRGNSQTTEEKTLDELLGEPQAEKIFGSDLQLLMKYVLVELGGYNLRNNISHALIFRENYLLNYGHWIFIILLRVGAYQFPIKQNETLRQ